MRLEALGVIGSPKRPQPAKRKRKARKPALPLLGATLATLAFSAVMLGSFDRIYDLAAMHTAPTIGIQTAKADTAMESWISDADHDGSADFANPTHGLIRAEDAYGSGSFGADRDGGKRDHHGVDYVAAPGAAVQAPITGAVTRIGFAYKNNSVLRYVELTNERAQLVARILYVDPSVGIGDEVTAGDAIGLAQDLSKKYPRITNHVHVEIDAGGVRLDPAMILPSGASSYAAVYVKPDPNAG